MKQYVIDELRPEDYEKVKKYMDEHLKCSGIDGIYWILLNQDDLTQKQASHTECAPFYFAIELEPERVSCELLVRCENRIRCDCISYANQTQRNWLIKQIDFMFEQLKIIS